MRPVPPSPNARPRLLNRASESRLLDDLAAAAHTERDLVAQADAARRRRNALVLHAVDVGIPYREVAEVCGLSLGTITRAVFVAASQSQQPPPVR